jgi:MAE_28990/MAE_18760-like HEPN
MSSFRLLESFNERAQEIDEYFGLLLTIESAGRAGMPRIGASGPSISATQQKMLRASVYVQLYNLVEATVCACLDAIAHALSSPSTSVHELTLSLRREWVRHHARSHKELSDDNRLNAMVDMVERLLVRDQLTAFVIERGGGGNWDDHEIENLMKKRLGVPLDFSPTVRANVKRRVRDDLGALELVKSLRNSLAHGSISFSECGESTTAGELQIMAEHIYAYLREMLAQCSSFIDRREYLLVPLATK